MRGVLKKAKKKASRLVDKLLSYSEPKPPPLAPPDPDPTLKAPSTGKHAYADPQPPPTASATAGSVVRDLLEAVRDGSDLFLPLKATLVGVVKIWDICERTERHETEYKNLESRLVQLRAIVLSYSNRSSLPIKLQQQLDDVTSSFKLLADCVEAKLQRGLPRRVLESRIDVDEVQAILFKISVRIEAFLFETVISISIDMDTILERLPTVQEQQVVKDLAGWGTIAKIIRSCVGNRRVYEAEYDVQPEEASCMPGTRLRVLSMFMVWAKDDPMRIFWLSGLAGTGKTSIAVSLCRMLQDEPKVLLGGTFFCSRTANMDERTDARYILPSLSASLAERSPQFAAALAEELTSDSRAAFKPVSTQIGSLLQRPLAALASLNRPIVFIIDALDECSDESEVKKLLRAIADLTCDAKVKFILTSRPETHISASPIASSDRNSILKLHTIDLAEVTEDIRLCISDAFSKHPLDEPWYGEADVRAVAARAEGLFIFASTIISYVLDTESLNERRNRLQKILSALNTAAAIGPLDAMYEFVLTRASNTAKVDPDELEATRQVLACILTARVPLSIRVAAELLERQVVDLRASLRRLHSVVHAPDEADDPGLRTLHASFGDYLFDRANSNIRLEASLGHSIIARGCLRIMHKQLHFNISQCWSAWESNPLTTPTNIPHSLEYACLEWIYHVSSLPEPSELDQEINTVFRPRLLFWLEVMSILDRVRRAAAMLLLAASIVRFATLSQFLRDAQAFVASSREAIEMSAPHIYMSALPFAAKESLVYKHFIALFTDIVAVDVFGIDHHSGRMVMTLTGHESRVYAVAYSPDGRLLASGCGEGTVRIWDTRTGEETFSPLQSDDGRVRSVAFAPNGRSLATGTDWGVVCLWGLMAGQFASQRLREMGESVWCVAFSLDGSLLAAATTGGTACIWNVRTGELLVILPHPADVNAVEFSPDSRFLASGSEDGRIRLWYSTTGEIASDFLFGSESAILGICFSPDGTMLASGLTGYNIQLWNRHTGRSIAILSGHSDWVKSVQFSPDGQRLVSGCDDCTIRLWNLQQNTLKAGPAVLYGHTDKVQRVTFSPDGLYVASASEDHSVRIWDVGTNQGVTQPLNSHSKAVHSVTVSPDGAFIVSGSSDRSIRVWNVMTGEPRLPPLLGHTDVVLSVAISSDGYLIASASWDCTIRFWDARTGDTVGEPLWCDGQGVFAVLFSPDSRWLVSGSNDGVVRIWELATRQQSHITLLDDSGHMRAVAFSPNGLLLAAGDRDGYIYLWNLENGSSVFEPWEAHDQDICAIDFSPDAKYIASGGQDMTIRVWDASTGQQALAFGGQLGWVLSVAYSPDGRIIGSGSADGVVRLWDASTGMLVSALHGHRGSVQSVIFVPDGQSIVSCSSDTTIRVWDVEAALSLPSVEQVDPAALLTCAEFEDGWFLGPAGELLLWIPPDYRAYLHVPPCTVLIGQRRVVITGSSRALHAGEGWTACWQKEGLITMPHNI